MGWSDLAGTDHDGRIADEGMYAMIVPYALLAAVLIAAAVAAAKSTDLIRSAVALCLGNSALAALFFLLSAPYAGSVQLSVGAGVVSALFIIAISLSEAVRGGSGDA